MSTLQDELKALHSKDEGSILYEKWGRGRPTKEAIAKRKAYTDFMHQKLMKQNGMFSFLSLAKTDDNISVDSKTKEVRIKYIQR